MGATACDHGPIIQLFDRIQAKGSFSETEAQAVMRKLLGALAYMHKKRIAHRDLKPENIMYKSATTDSEPALTDFGFAKKAQPIEEDVPQGGAAPPPGALKTRLGSPNYVAPEILTSKTGYDTAVDIWSVGVILYILLCGYFPFFHESERELYRQIKSGKYDMPDEEWRHVSNNAKDLVRKMLTLDPKKRITAHNALRHPWLRGKASGEVFPEEQLKAFADMQKIRKRSFKQAGKAVAAALRTAKAGGQGGGNANVGDVAVLATQKALRARDSTRSTMAQWTPPMPRQWRRLVIMWTCCGSPKSRGRSNAVATYIGARRGAPREEPSLGSYWYKGPRRGIRVRAGAAGGRLTVPARELV